MAEEEKKRSFGEFLKDTIEGKAYQTFKEEEGYKPAIKNPVAEGIYKGVIDGTKGLAQVLGIGVDLASNYFDFIPDTNTLETIEEIWPKVKVDSTVGEVSALLTQYALPAGVIGKLAGPLVKLKRVKIKNLDPFSKEFKKGSYVDLTKAVGFYGGIGGITDTLVSTPGDNYNLFFDEDREIKDRTGSDRAVATLKEKLKFGAEGFLLGGIPASLPAVGLGVKYGLFKPIEVVAKGPGKIVVNRVLDPIIDVTAKGLGYEKGLPTLLRKAGEIKDKFVKGYPKFEEWRMFDPNSVKTSERILKKIDRFILAPLRSSGNMTPEAAALVRDAEKAVAVDVRTANDLLNLIDEKVYDIGKKFKKNFFDRGQSDLIMNQEKEKIFDFLKGEIKLNNLNEIVREPAKDLKKLITKLNQTYGEALDPKIVKELGLSIVKDADSYLKQTFSAFHNESYSLSKSFRKEAIKNAEGYIKNNPELLQEVIDTMPGVFARAGKKAAMLDPTFNAQLNKAANKLIDSVLTQARNAELRPDQIIKGVATTLKFDPKLVKARGMRIGEQFPDFIKRTLGETKDYRNSVLDTIIQASKLTYDKRLFDALLDEGLKNKWIFSSREMAALPRSKGGIDMLNTNRLQRIERDYGKGEFFQSKMFEQDYFTTPEIRNAIHRTHQGLQKFMDVPLYKSVMAMKSGAQFAKTVLSPMTQIRNVTSASMFATANGLVGGKASLIDAFKFIADDIAKTDDVISFRKMQEIIDDKISRGILDENIVTQELKAVFDKSKKSKFASSEALIDFLTTNKYMKKATELYQGGDNVWKFYADEFYQQALRPAIKSIKDVDDWYKAVAGEKWNPSSIRTGSTKSLEDGIKDISAWLTTNTMPTYSRVPKVIEQLRSLPLGNFIAFPSEMIRTTSNILNIGAKELTSKNPYIRQMGARRLIGLAATTAGFTYATKEAAHYMTGVGRDVLDAYQRSYGPYYEKTSTLLPVTAPDEKGNFKYINLSYFNPYDYVQKPVAAILKAFGAGVLSPTTADKIVFDTFFGDPLTNTPGVIEELLAPFISESIALETFLDVTVRGGKKKTGAEVYYPQEKFTDKFTKSLVHVIGALEPGAFRSAKRIWQGATDRYSDYGTMFDTKSEAIALLGGVRLQDAKPASSIPFVITSFNKDQKNINDQFADVAYKANNTLEDKLNAYKQAMMQSYDSQKRMQMFLEDSRTIGVPYYILEENLENRLTKSKANKILDGEFIAPTYSKDAIESALNRMQQEAIDRLGELPDTQRFRALYRAPDIFENMKDAMSGFSLRRSKEEFESILDRILKPYITTEQEEKPGIRYINQSREESRIPNLGPGIVESPSVNPQVVMISNPLAGLVQGTGLTANENALLSPAEQAIRLRQRGLG